MTYISQSLIFPQCSNSLVKEWVHLIRTRSFKRLEGEDGQFDLTIFYGYVQVVFLSVGEDMGQTFMAVWVEKALGMGRGIKVPKEVQGGVFNVPMIIEPVPTVIFKGHDHAPPSPIEGGSVEEPSVSQLTLDFSFQKSSSFLRIESSSLIMLLSRFKRKLLNW